MAEYISREAVVRYLKDYSDKELNSESHFGMITASVLKKAERVILAMPAAGVQPVKHGRWEDCSNGWMCSCCERDNTKDTPFCPNCGARMDGDAE